MELHENPYLQQEDYLAGYQENIERFREYGKAQSQKQIDAADIAMQQAQGKKFIDLIKERYLLPSLAHYTETNYKNVILWGEGFKDFPRMILNCIRSHEQRIKAEGNK